MDNGKTNLKSRKTSNELDSETKKTELERLRAERNLLEKELRAKDRFLAVLSHELRTPLTPVLVATIAMEENRALPPDVLESLAMIRRNVELQARLIDDLLDLTRITSGKLELNLAAMDYHEAIERALNMCTPEIRAKSQNVLKQFDAKKITGSGDITRLQQVVWNLIRNASKFTDDAGLIMIRTTNPTPSSIRIEVKDTGNGFEPEASEKLFRAFEQGGRHITRSFGGLGLGLAISRSIVEAHGGKIHAHSDGPGYGAVFTLELPLVPCKPARTKTATSQSAGFSPKRILLVEDHHDTRLSLEILLRKNSHEVKSAGSASEALELAKKHQFDLVIGDIGLPDQSGLDLMRRLKEEFNLKGIGLSGYGMEEDIARSLDAGFMAHLTKPIHFDQLKELIARVN